MGNHQETGLVGTTDRQLSPGADDRSGEATTLIEKPNDTLYELTIPARIEAVGPLCAFIKTTGECHGLTELELQCLEISAYETCLNIIEHAYGFDSSGRILIRIHLGLKRVCVAFVDSGTGINPELIPPPDVNDPNVRRRGRGFGLQIIRKSVNRMRYRRMPSGENHFLLMKELAREDKMGTDAVAIRGGDVT